MLGNAWPQLMLMLKLLKLEYQCVSVSLLNIMGCVHQEIIYSIDSSFIHR